MKVSTTKFFRPKIFEAGQIANALKNFLIQQNIDFTEIRFTLGSYLDAFSSTKRTLDFSELHSICELDKINRFLAFTYFTNNFYWLGLQRYDDSLHITLECESLELANSLMKSLISDLGLEEVQLKVNQIN